jgi:hypothetical protein
MTQRTGLNLMAVAAIVVYGVAQGCSLFIYPHFWTSKTMGSEVPWYFIGQTFITGLCAAAGLLVVGILGLLAQRSLGKAVWGSLMPAILFLSFPLGQGMNVLLHTRRVWTGQGASTDWSSFEQYLTSTSLAAFLSLAVATVLALRFRRHWSEGAG